MMKTMWSISWKNALPVLQIWKYLNWTKPKKKEGSCCSFIFDGGFFITVLKVFFLIVKLKLNTVTCIPLFRGNAKEKAVPLKKKVLTSHEKSL